MTERQPVRLTEIFDLAVNDVNGVYKTAPTSGVSR